MDYRDFETASAPTAFQKPYGRAWNRAFGIVKDYLLARTKLALKERMPGVGSSLALGAIGHERLVDRGAGPQLPVPETDSAYSARVKGAWDIWYWGGTAYGMLLALAEQGYFPFILQQNGVRSSLDSSWNLVRVAGAPFGFGAPNLWNTFLVFLSPVPTSWSNIQNPPTLSSAPNSNEIARLTRIIGVWRPAHMSCLGLRVLISGHVWGFPSAHVWGDSTWGGVTSTFSIPLTPPI